MEKLLNDEIEQRKIYISENLKTVKYRIEEAAIKSGRKPEDIKLLAATKTVPAELINYAISLGVEIIGENRVQELLSKVDDIDTAKSQVHFIGHLQTNKVKKIVGNVDMIQSVDSIRLASEISKVSLSKNIVTDILVEVNIGYEENKSGVMIEYLDEFLYEISNFKGICIKGLMIIPPICQDIGKSRKYFSKIYKIFIDIKNKRLDNINMNNLSMGMSSDYYEAILEGASMVRIGSSLFGARKYRY